MQTTVFFFLFITQVSSGVTGSVKRTVKVKEGETITLQSDVTEQHDRITWLFEKTLIVESSDKGDKYKTNTGRFKNRLQLDNQTAALTVKSVSSDDEGMYELHIGNASTWEFNCSVYTPVNVPTIRRVYSQNSSQCSVECSVKNGREVTVSWYRGNDMLNETNSSDINVHTKVTLNTEWTDNGTYYCVAFNPVSNRTTQLNISEVCVQDSTFIVVGMLFMILLVGLIMVVIYCGHKRLSKIKFEAAQSVEEINYVDISIQGHALKPNVKIDATTRETETENLVQCSDDMILYSDVKTF